LAQRPLTEWSLPAAREAAISQKSFAWMLIGALAVALLSLAGTWGYQRWDARTLAASSDKAPNGQDARQLP
jgi:hypothetical protein